VFWKHSITLLAAYYFAVGKTDAKFGGAKNFREEYLNLIQCKIQSIPIYSRGIRHGFCPTFSNSAIRFNVK
jgi:hypothetical protein